MNQVEVTGVWIGEGCSARDTNGEVTGAHTIAAFEPPYPRASATIMAVMAQGLPMVGPVSRDAANIAVAAVIETFAGDTTGTIPARLARGFEAASGRVAALGEYGCTCAAIVITNRRLFIASIGDARIFLRRGETLRQVSVTHTFSHDLGQDDMGSNVRDYLTRILGAAGTEVDLRLRLLATDDDEHARLNQGMTLRPGDRVIMTGGGTFPMMLFPRMYGDYHLDILRDEAEPQIAVDRFISAHRDLNWPGPCRVVAIDIPDRC